MTRTHFDTKQGRTVTRADLAEAVYGRVGLSRADSAEMVEVVLGEISAAVIGGEVVKLSSFGSFMVRMKGERVGRNPKTGIEVPITPRMTPSSPTEGVPAQSACTMRPSLCRNSTSMPRNGIPSRRHRRSASHNRTCIRAPGPVPVAIEPACKRSSGVQPSTSSTPSLTYTRLKSASYSQA